MRNNPEERGTQLLRGGSLKSRSLERRLRSATCARKLLKVGLIRLAETPIRKYHPALRDVPAERRTHLPDVIFTSK